jgi:amino acid adenylation domain-containing protein/thioester reductase-like protein
VVLADWNCTATDYPREVCMHELFERQARAAPDAVALVDGPQQCTYAELERRANQLAHELRARGAGPERLVAVRLPRSAGWAAALLGVLKAGAAYLPLDPHLPAERLRFALEDARVDCIVTLEGLAADLPPGLPHVVRLDADAGQIAERPTDAPPRTATPRNLAYVIYTSGSTGRPKGVMIEHQALVNYALAAADKYRITAADRVLQFASASYDAHVEELYPCWARGATLVLRNEEMLDCKRFLDLCDEWRLSFVTLPTAFWHELTAAMQAEKLALPATLRTLVIGGEQALPQRVAAWFECVGERVRLLNTYGPTETTVVATGTELCRDDGRQERLPIGRPLANMRAYVLDARRQPLPVGVRGELYIGGASLARGYLNSPELTAQRFVADPFAGQPGARMYNTGDAVRWRPDGQLEFLGRTDQQVKIRGFRIEPGEVERVLHEHPGVAEAAVVARERTPGNLQLAAYVCGRGGASPAAEQLRRFLAQRLPEFMIPAAFVVLDALPTTNSGKIDRRALPPPEWGVSSRAPGAAPRTATQRQLAAIWCELLGIEAVGAEDDFFDLGGHSLLALRLMSRVREQFAVELPLVRLFTAPTLAALAESIDLTRQGSAAGAADRGPATDWQAETELDAAVRVTPQLRPVEAPPAHVLLTGATGFLGAFLLRELLRRTPVRVHCLVRSRSDEEARQKILRNLAQYELDVADALERIVPVCGDLAEPRLGLPEEQFQTLAAQLDAICHNGAQVGPFYPYRVLKPANVQGTAEVLRLATQVKIKPLHFVSTISVFEAPQYQSGEELDENSPLLTIDGLTGGYAQSKCVAEKLVREAGNRGLPVVVYRPGRITAESTSGVANAADQTTLLLKLCIDLGAAPQTDAEIDMTPVDYVARAIVALASAPGSIGRTFHLMNPQPVPVREVYRAIRASGYDLQEVPFSRWRTMVIQRGAGSADTVLAALSHLLLVELPDEAAEATAQPQPPPLRIGCVQTVQALQGGAVSCPAVDCGVLMKYFEYLGRRGFLGPPEGRLGI